MGDALCGPSNALQSLQKHTAADRSLQQDRLRSQQAQSQGFRSHPGPNASLLDPEFEDFQAGNVTTFPEPRVLNRPQIPLSHLEAHPFQPHSGAPDWASDFQHLQISQPPHGSLAQQKRPAQHQSPPDWHLEFQRQQQQRASSSYQPSQSYYPSRQIGAFPYASGGSLAPQSFGPQANSPLQHGQQDQRSQELELAAFEREFEVHASELLKREAERQDEQLDKQLDGPSMELGQDVIIDQAKLDLSQKLEEAQDAMEHPVMNEDDELAKTAGELLDRVSDNQTQKFQESSFLSFMRQLRDREVRVEGDKVVDVEVSTTFHPQQAPEQSSSTARTSSPRPESLAANLIRNMTADAETSSEQGTRAAPAAHIPPLRGIPPDEQDDDRGKDMQMAGALMDERDSASEEPRGTPSSRRRHSIDPSMYSRRVDF